MYSPQLEELITAVLSDGVLTEKERAVLHRRAAAEGVDADELDIILDARLAQMRPQAPASAPMPQPMPAPIPRPAAPMPQPVAPMPQPAPATSQFVQKPAQSNKLGSVVKCPNCGAQVVSGLAVCPSCRYAFNNVAANSASKTLMEKLDEINNSDMCGQEKDTAKMDIVSTLPVPNTRADLLEILSLSQQKAKATGSRSGEDGDLSYGFWLLYSNCINKAKISFANDAAFQPFFQHYDKEMARSKTLWGRILSLSTTVKLSIGLVLLWLFLFVIAYFVD